MIVEIEKFNSLSEFSNRKVLCKCDRCGSERYVIKASINRKEKQDRGQYKICTSCHGTKMQAILSGKPADNLIGKNFRFLTVIDKGKRKHYKSVYWLCRCICGEEKEIRADLLKKGDTGSCGCRKNFRSSNFQKKRGPKGSSGLTSLYLSYKSKAKHRGLTFSLTKEDFANITNKDCFYCSSSPKQERANKHKGLTAEGVENSKYLYNGIDRKNPKVGYILDNCVPCCGTCNWAKLEKSQNDFYDWIDNLVSFRRNQQKEELYLVN